MREAHDGGGLAASDGHTDRPPPSATFGSCHLPREAGEDRPSPG